MALESQGVLIRRASSVAITYASTGLAFVTAAGTNIVCDHATADFQAAGFTSGMRIITNSSNNQSVYTISAVTATAINLYEAVVNHNVTSLQITGYKMENIGSVVSFNGPGGAAAVIDITCLQSTAKEKMIGLRDEGQVSIEVLLDTTASSSQHMNLKDDRATRTKRQFDIVLTDKTTNAGAQSGYLFFSGYVSNFSVAGAVDQAVKATMTLELSSDGRWVGRVG